MFHTHDLRFVFDFEWIFERNILKMNSFAIKQLDLIEPFIDKVFENEKKTSFRLVKTKKKLIYDEHKVPLFAFLNTFVHALSSTCPFSIALCATEQIFFVIFASFSSLHLTIQKK